MKKKLLILISLLFVILIGITYAWWRWTGTNTNVTFTIEGITVTYSAGNDISGIKLIPVSSKEKGVTDNTAIYKEITVSASSTVYFDLNMNLEIFDSGLQHESLVWAIYTGDTLVNLGNFGNAVEGGTIKLLRNREVTTTSTTYKLYIWIDGMQPNSPAMMNQDYKFVLNATATDETPNLDTSGANEPILGNSLIPITYKDKSCSQINDLSYEDYPSCYDFVYSETDITKLVNFCVSIELGDTTECQSIVSQLVTEGSFVYDSEEIPMDDYLDYYMSEYPEDTIGHVEANLENTTSTVVKADSKNKNITYKWYDYDNKQWANAVLVTDTNRTTYQNANEGMEISTDDILGYYVWIPRYKYKVFNINKEAGIDSYNAQTTGIDIVFENGTTTSGTVTCTNYSFAEPSAAAQNETCSGANGEYYTHPAFTFGNESIEGFWMGKFELTGTGATPTVLPNSISMLDQTATGFYKTIKDMGLTNNIYGITSNMDSHMIKNMEWGAVAYLTHSDYGRCTNNVCTEITVNNNENHYTGGNDYITNINQSTTANIYGVYDMSGGLREDVMGNMSRTYNTYTYYASDGGEYFTYGAETAKYIDTYAKDSGVAGRDYKRSRLGDATSEVIIDGDSSFKDAWNNDGTNELRYNYSWISRGGQLWSNESAGIFNFDINDGDSREKCNTLMEPDCVGSRPALIILSS